MPSVRDVVVVGAGLSGLMAVYRLKALGIPTIWVIGGGVDRSNSVLAQGGIAAALSPEDSVDAHLQDTVIAGDGLVEEDVARGIISEGAQIVSHLVHLGVPFDKNPDGTLNMTREGAHSRRRILHIKDETGKGMMHYLFKFVSGVEKVRGRLVDLLVEDGEAYGVRVKTNGHTEDIYASAVILATGGYTGMYIHSTGNADQDGVGIALAAHYGAVLRDTEFIQFHPTVFFGGGKAFLITEAVRGEGAILLDSKGERFMVEEHPMAELAPRDIVARAIHRRGGAYLDFRPIQEKGIDIEERFPHIVEVLRKEGIDPLRELVPVYPAAHYYIGGIKVDWWGQSDIKRLMVIGEAASTGLHGANRLASNSLLECVVMGYRSTFRAWWYATQEPHREVPKFESKEYENLSSDGHLKGQMSRHAGIIRNGYGLRKVARKLLSHMENGNLPLGSQRWAQIMLSGATICSGWWRTESRGAHYREDYPEKWKEKKHSHITLKEIRQCLERMGGV
ncbi:MAG: L-aspartate oxidase [Dictyoglomi bacterium]|nr:L-aspartate oxidase [Dictyoglomota bacterium]